MSWLRKELIKTPRWVKPEITQPIYYVHIIIIALVVLGLLQVIFGGEMLTVKAVIISIPLLTAGDLLAHTILGLD